jgi:DNA-binding NtrC family response regulator
MVPQPQLRPRAARILIVEDEVLTRAFIAEELRLAGFRVIEADRADDARSTDCNWLKHYVIISRHSRYSHVRKCRTKARRNTLDICSQAIRRHANNRTHVSDLSSKVFRRTPMSDPCILIVELDLLVRTPLAEYLRE